MGAILSSQRISPVLVGRDDLLALGNRRAAGTLDGRGHVLFLAGEAGIGKSRLLGAIVRSADRQGLRGSGAATSPRDLELAGALLLDLGHQLGRSASPDWQAAGGALVERLSSVDPTRGDTHRQRRLLVLDSVDLVASLATSGPVVLGLEDLHWADDLTLEILGHLARRLADLPMLVVATYRSDELYPRVPMREWRGYLVAQRLAEEARLPRLDIAQTGAMATMLLGGELPAPARLVEALHRRSDGIPLHVEELLGAMEEDPQPSGGSLSAVPETLTDAILRRAALLSRAAQRVAASASVIGQAFDLDLLCAVHRASAERVGPAISELQQRFFVVAREDGSFDFRHALIRDALEGALEPATRRRLHARVAEAASTRPDVGDDAFLSAHWELGGNPARAFHHARQAAARAAALSSHREALDLARRALRTCPSDLPPRERAALLRGVAAEEAATDDNASAAAHLEEARTILQAAGDAVAAAELMPPLIAARHLLGDGLEARADRLREEIEALGTHDGGASGTRGRLLAALSAAYMLDRRLDESIAHGQEALRLAELDGDAPTRFNVTATVASCMVFSGRMEEGWTMLAEAVGDARSGRREAEAARAYRMIGSSASVLVEYDLAERWLREGIDYAERTEQWNHRHYMAAHLAHVEWATGQWEDARRAAEHALADGRGGITTTITALHVRGYVALGRGELSQALAALAEARRLGEEMNELQRLSPALWGLAEAALLAGGHEEAAALSEEALAASRRVEDAAYLFPFLVTGTRARLAAGDTLVAERWVETVTSALRRRSIPGTLPAVDHARGLLELAAGSTGRARESLAAARRGWVERRRWWEGAWCGIDLARCQHRSNRPAEAAGLLSDVLAEAERIGAVAIVESGRELHALLRARHPADDPWAPLSAREYEVARLIAQGLTNRQIADELGISPKTVAAHVEHILARLGAGRRSEIAAWAASVAGGAAP